ncbi:SDR family NAD(P)-dependent oxidoreductase [Mycolicibacterium sp. P1-18]|uniref:SDR family NAD(P)-dependent oxidoreductase n=1 Tax=Mycolicibacterium sp. P1-18 TaxID=2024615 RepID=UPI0011F21A0E|nr:SDR family NAD(P)-dependent oxidoreductase [Mycolicibacterium sp. P1-18]KAA0090387.1 SDR family NAD(P)-dependent oxidoreductase [Mycolicibacterium sp. P1-18]
MLVTDLLDAALDRSVVLGYSRIGSGVRKLWWAADPGPTSMAGKRVVVTGATSGLGEAMAASFARLGATVHLLGRNPEKVRHSAEAIRSAVPGSVVVDEVCDVGDLDAVRAWTDDLSGRVDALHGLVHNAGLMPKRRDVTPQGHELQLACHVLGPQVMTERLLPLLRNAGGASVVFVSSGGMYSAPLSVGDLESARGEYDGVRVYAKTKRMQVVLADAWARRLAEEHVRVESMHPGWARTPGVSEALPTFQRLTGPILRDAADGGDTAVWLVATRPPSHPPHFWHDRAQRPTTFGWQRPQDAAVVARFLDEVSAMTDTSHEWIAMRA